MSTPARGPEQPGKPKTPAEVEARKQQVLTRQAPSQVRSIAEALVAKDRDLFFLCDRFGDVPLEGGHGFGLYFEDTRYLCGYSLRLAGERAHALAGANRGGYKAVLQLTNPALELPGGHALEAQTLGVAWSRLLRGERRCMYDVLEFENYGLEALRLPLELAFRADFEPVFTVRGLTDDRPGRVRAPCWQDERTLCFAYDGADGRLRRLSVHFSEPPARHGEADAHFTLALGPRERHALMVAVEVSEAPEGAAASPHMNVFPNLEEVERWAREDAEAWIQEQTCVTSDSLLLNRIVERGLRDLHTLQSELDGQPFIAAGVPWFATLFGRDSLIAALETLAYHPGVAEGTLRLLARYQGRCVDPWRDEEPGKILHELRVGELSRLGLIPHDPYYGSVDATPLFLILLVEHARWTGRRDLFDELREHVEHALAWIDRHGEHYLGYHSGTARGLINQGWKDSGNAIVNADGSLAVPPIAPVEVQGYVYRAKSGLAELFERTGEPGRATRLREEAAALRTRFNADYWVAHERFFALAREQHGRLAEVVSSNPGQALWGGIVEPEKAAAVACRLMAPDMFSGWGVRTLSSRERRYNPNSYHLGSVWPHDNALIAAGLRRYGHDREALAIFRGLFEAASRFEQYRLPELFAGFSSADYPEPVRYPVACHPQAWAAGAVPYLLVTLLGLEPDGFERRLRLVRPLLPAFVDTLELHGLRVGGSALSLRVCRDGEGLQVTRLAGEVALEVLPEG